MAEVVLQTKELTKTFGAVKAVNSLSLEVYEGEVFGFLGPNGAGKTTSITMMCGLSRPDSGQVWIQGQPVRYNDPKTFSRVGVCPQEIILWERLTSIEQLTFMGQMYGLSTVDARHSGFKWLEELELTEKANTQSRHLSGGMKRRLNIAMALVHDPELVILDEPEAGLDPQSRVRVRQTIKNLARKKTIILTTHNMDEAERMADRIAIIDHGRLLVLDTPENLKKSVGQGDVVEMALDPPCSQPRILEADLCKIVSQAKVDSSGTQLILRSLNIVALLPSVMDVLKKSGLKPGEIRLRANTLEDVFIQLTGRTLRQ